MSGYRDAPPDPGPPEKGPYQQLVAYARFRRVPYAGAVSLSFEDHGRTVRLTYSLNSGTVDGYDVSVPIARTPELLLRPETGTDREGKSRGINREVQVGDFEFDQRVYIETEAEDQAVLRVLTPEVRAAVLRLFDKGATSITFGRQVAEFKVPMSERRKVFEPTHIEAVIAATRALVHIPPARPSAVVPNTGGSGTVWLSVLFSVVAVPSMVAALTVWPLASPWLPLLAAGFGWFAWALSRNTFARANAGHSRSYRRYLTSLTFTFIAFPAAAIAIAVAVNGGFDNRANRLREGRIYNVSSDEDGTTVDVRWDDGSSTSTSGFTGVPKKGARVRGRFRTGALGAEWRSEPLEVRFVVSSATAEP